jgi:hypothetical protein
MHDFFKNFDEASAQFHKAHYEEHKKAHENAHRKAQEYAKKDFFGFDFDSLFDDDYASELGLKVAGEDHSDLGNLFGGDGIHSQHVHMHTSHLSSSHDGRQNCRTITRREGNSVSTITQCQ